MIISSCGSWPDKTVCWQQIELSGFVANELSAFYPGRNGWSADAAMAGDEHGCPKSGSDPRASDLFRSLCSLFGCVQTMSWHREWKAIEESISDLTGICRDFVSAMGVRSTDSFGTIKNIILPMTSEIAERITVLGQRYSSQLPATALGRIKDLEDVHFESGYASATQKEPTAVAHFSSKLQKFRSDFNYLTSDLEGTAVRLTARAFLHLQRSIVADASVREKWKAALAQHEMACEKLGAVHLLQHGIWSFKVDSIGERTDLVLGEALTEQALGDVYLSAEGLVLTEWKIATQSNCKQKYQEAFVQAERYARGSLAAIELKGYRYLVIVSEGVLSDVPADYEKEGVIYKHINIPVDPSSPSTQARKKRAKLT